MAEAERQKRAEPGTQGEGEYFRIVLRSKDEFTTFRYHDVGDKGHIQRLAAQRSNGSWETQAWLISKGDAHIEGDGLVADTDDARKLIAGLGSKPKHVEGDVFEAKDGPNASAEKE